MYDHELARLPYRRPPMNRGIDPQRLNWLWRLICELGEVQPDEVVEALHAAVVPVDAHRARSWTVGDRDPGFFPITLAELERNMRALIALRQAREHTERGLRRAVADSAALDGDPPARDLPLEW
ncbi:hypothetical protein [Dyella ginsengisoli]|uniref:hypothetical protein n=1 Tax=Dyella ginsengisoli TaxID=363848 RepID=UPI000345350E|nr:hypothetical protein [Dyella ginsengisoli]